MKKIEFNLKPKIMKFPNYLISSLAVVGAFSLIIMACSADNSNSTNNVNATGKYQITAQGAAGFYILDTETGVVKTFTKNSGETNYTLKLTTITQ